MSDSYRDSYDALNQLVPRSEHGRAALYLQEVGLWPLDLSPESARARMSACLNPAKSEKLGLPEINALTQWTRRDHVANFLADVRGLSRPRILNPDELVGEAVEQLRQVAEQATVTLENANRLLKLAQARTDRTAITPRFSYPADSDEEAGW